MREPLADPHEEVDARNLQRRGHPVHELNDRLVELEKQAERQAQRRGGAEYRKQPEYEAQGDRERNLLRGDALSELRQRDFEHAAAPEAAPARARSAHGSRALGRSSTRASGASGGRRQTSSSR